MFPNNLLFTELYALMFSIYDTVEHQLPKTRAYKTIEKQLKIQYYLYGAENIRNRNKRQKLELKYNDELGFSSDSD